MPDVTLTEQEHKALCIQGMKNKPEAAPNPGPGYWWVQVANPGFHRASSWKSNDGYTSWDIHRLSYWCIVQINTEGPINGCWVFGTDEMLSWDHLYGPVVIKIGPKIKEPE